MIRRTAQGRRVQPIVAPSSGRLHQQTPLTTPQSKPAKTKPQEMIRQPMRINLNP